MTFTQATTFFKLIFLFDDPGPKTEVLESCHCKSPEFHALQSSFLAEVPYPPAAPIKIKNIHIIVIFIFGRFPVRRIATLGRNVGMEEERVAMAPPNESGAALAALYYRSGSKNRNLKK